MKRIFDMAPNHLRRELQINNILGELKVKSNSGQPNNGDKRKDESIGTVLGSGKVKIAINRGL